MQINKEALRQMAPDEAINILLATIEMLTARIETLTATVDRLTAENKELRIRLGLNSSNSSKPPSSDGFKKLTPTRKPSTKKPGGQPGHKGSGLKAPINPDYIKEYEPTQCINCPKRQICKADRDVVSETRYEIDIEIKPVSTAHRQISVLCPQNNKLLQGKFPERITGLTQYGTNLEALAIALNTIGMVSMGRTQEILGSVFGVSMSPGTIASMVENCAGTVADTVEEIRQAVLASPVVHFDETGTRVEKKTEWVHVASTRDLTYIAVDEKRGTDGMNRVGILPEYEGIAIHDCLAAYFTYDDMEHGLCNAHLLRELTSAAEDYGQAWAKELTALLLEMKGEKARLQDLGINEVPQPVWAKFSQRYDQILCIAQLANPMPEKTPNTKGRIARGKMGALVDRLLLRKSGVCLFFTNFAVPFDNNQAERDIRMFKVKQKVSGCFRSKDGASGFATIMSFIGTARKRGISAFLAIKEALLGGFAPLGAVLASE